MVIIQKQKAVFGNVVRLKGVYQSVDNVDTGEAMEAQPPTFNQAELGKWKTKTTPINNHSYKGKNNMYLPTSYWLMAAFYVGLLTLVISVHIWQRSAIFRKYVRCPGTFGFTFGFWMSLGIIA